MIQPGSDRIGRVGNGDGEIHIGAVAVKEAVEHLVISGVVPKGVVGRVQAKNTGLQAPVRCAQTAVNESLTEC